VRKHALAKLIALLILLAGALDEQAAQSAQPPSAAGESGLTKVRISQSAVNTRSAVLWIAKGQGFFAKYGLDVETIYLRSSNLQMAAMATGDVQFGSSGGAPVLSAVAGGQDLKIVASPSNKLSYDVVVRPEIKEAKDLRGKRFGVTNIGGTTWMAAILALEHLGLDASRDQVRINAIGNQTILAQAIEAGNIDVTLLDPFLSRRMKQKGLSVIVELYRAKIPFVNTSLVVNGNYLRDHPHVTEYMLKGLIEAQSFISLPANRNSVLQTMMQQIKLNDPITLEEGYQDLLVGFERKPYGTPEGLRNIQRMMGSLNPNVSRVKVDNLIDNRFVRKLDESGFIDALYAKR
jgi:ABC-type nitrate/sulfonate/bicarbonate transport system substrate-binding protein